MTRRLPRTLAQKDKAKILLSMLREKHDGDVFVTECKDGATQTRSHYRLDAWAMKKSWANPLTIGYEIKVSRADFLQDNKWMKYLPLCNQLYFVVPPGIIQSHEVPEQAGLIIGSTNMVRIFTKKKAPYRPGDPPVNVLRYILYCRAKITREHELESNSLYWRQWLKGKQGKSVLGRSVAKELNKRVAERIKVVEEENKLLKEQNATFDETKELLAELGIDVDSVSRWQLQHKVQELQRVVPADLERSTNYAIERMLSFQEALKKITENS